jgi:hypothetical protein
MNAIILAFRSSPLLTALVVLLASATRGSSQPPSLLWATNVGAQVFAVDNQTNVYAFTNGVVIKLNAAGVPVQTNVLNPALQIVRRDASGNFWGAGTNIATTNFVNMPPGFFNTYSNLAYFVAKYNSDCELVASTNFGTDTAFSIAVGDVQIASDGSVYVGVDTSFRSSIQHADVYKFDTSASNVWSIQSLPGSDSGPGQSTGTVLLGMMSATNGYAMYSSWGSSSGFYWRMDLSGFSSDGASSGEVASGYYPSVGNPFTSRVVFSRPIADGSGNFYDVEGVLTATPTLTLLTKRTSSGAVLWTNSIAFSSGTVGADAFGGVHVADLNGNLYRYDSGGNLVWTLGLPANCNQLVLDGSGNRFISLQNGTVARLGAEGSLKPSITNALQGTTVFAGTDVILTAGATGTAPLAYYWYFNGGYLTNTSVGSLDLGATVPAQGGEYSLIVSNALGTATNPAVSVRVKSVQLYIGSQMLTNGTYSFSNAPTISVHSTFTNGSVYYTLDGSAPDFTGTLYTGPFTLSSNATVQAIGYSADFSQSEEADPANIVLLTAYMLSASSSVGGSVSLNPPGGTYTSSADVVATANPDSGWQFLYWQGDAAGTNAAVHVIMTEDKSVHAVFGTTLSTSVTGNGQVMLWPPGGVYAYGQTVRLTGVPQAGSYFGAWGTAAGGNTNPLYFVVTGPNPTISSVFGTLASNQASLTILISGPGHVAASPRANVYVTNTMVTLTATPDAGETFVGWSGSVSSTQNPLSLLMNQSQIITANFSSPVALRVLSQEGDGPGPAGFRLTLVGDPGTIGQIYTSSNLTTWSSLGYFTNTTGTVQFTDPSAAGADRRYYRVGP